MNIQYPSSRSRSPVIANQLVATSQPLATQAGVWALQQGGNAVDAALTTAITLTVVEPTMNGIGSDGFALIWDGDQLHAMNASGRAPMAWTPEYFKNLSKMPATGWGSVTVPGAVSGWLLLSERFGKLPFEMLFEKAIHYAEEGFPVSPVISRQWREQIPTFENQPGFKEAFIRDGRAPSPGEIWRFPEQAVTLRKIAQSKGKAFYEGEIAQNIVNFSNKTGGSFTLQDFANHQANWVEPLGCEYGEYQLFEIPPNGSGLAAQIALKILDILQARNFPHLSAKRIHLQIEAMRLAFADVCQHLSDPQTMLVTTADLLSTSYLKERATLIDFNKAGMYPAGNPHSGGTVYLCASDSSGMMVSYIQSNFKGFGSGVVAPGGIALQNRGMGFSLEPGHPNLVAPGKRPFHTIIPGFLMKNQQPVMAFGVMGGNMQPQGHLQMVMNFVDEQFDPQACSNVPRWRIADNGDLTVEANMPLEVINGLTELGHQVTVMPKDSIDFGSAQAIVLMKKSNHPVYIGGSDHRRDGQVAGF
jgi:gamma-glutamyltranspeptidase / glutathione hydrolase